MSERGHRRRALSGRSSRSLPRDPVAEEALAQLKAARRTAREARAALSTGDLREAAELATSLLGAVGPVRPGVGDPQPGALPVLRLVHGGKDTGSAGAERKATR